MSVSNLAIALSVTFIVFLIAIAGELFYVLHRRQSFRRHSSPPPPITSGGETRDFSTAADPPTKELLYLFCLKPDTRVELDPSGLPNKNTNVSSQDQDMIDVFKLLEANGPSRFFSTIKEENKEEESSHDVDFFDKLLKEEVLVMVDEDNGNTKTVFSTPCDSPLFFTPDGSPSRDFTVS